MIENNILVGKHIKSISLSNFSIVFACGGKRTDTEGLPLNSCSSQITEEQITGEKQKVSNQGNTIKKLYEPEVS